jgi:hypothetical protein
LVLDKIPSKNNPNVIGISEKLFKPKFRNLKKSSEVWRFYLTQKPDTRCIYSNTLLPARFSLDHFIPWSYTVHDMNWNLIPVRNQVNSSKGDCLPNLEVYLTPFIKLQFDFYSTVFGASYSAEILEHYCILFNTNMQDLKNIPFEVFEKKFKQTMTPMYELASNIGFKKGWIFNKESRQK